MYYIYLLKSKRDKKLYIGFTAKLNQRIKQHNDGKVFSTRYRRPFDVIYYEAYRSFGDARRREKNLKLFSKAYYGLKGRILDSV